MRLPVIDFLSKVRQATSIDKAPAVSVDESASLLHVFGKLAATHMHRVFVVSTRGAPVAVITVEDVVKLIHKGYPAQRHQRAFHKAPDGSSAPSLAASAAGSLAVPSRAAISSLIKVSGPDEGDESAAAAAAAAGESA